MSSLLLVIFTLGCLAFGHSLPLQPQTNIQEGIRSWLNTFDKENALNLSPIENSLRSKRNTETNCEKIKSFARDLFKNADEDSNTYLNWNEFVSLFRDFDIDANDFLSEQEYVDRMIKSTSIDRGVASRMFVKGDFNHNERLDQYDLKIVFDHFNTDDNPKIISQKEYIQGWVRIAC